MNKTIPLEGRGVIPCPQDAGAVHSYQGPPLPAPDLLILLSRAMARHAQLGVAIDNLRRILLEDGILRDDPFLFPSDLLQDTRFALDLAQSVIPGIHREVLSRITRALERIDLYQDALPARGQA